MDIIDTIKDKQLFASWFKKLKTWRAWLVFLKALFALPMDADDLALYTQCTGRTQPPTEPAREASLVVGRRGGKSFICALIAVFLACFRNYKQYLAPGERGIVMILACDRAQAQVILRFAVALIENTPMLSRMVERTTAEGIELNNRIAIEVHTSSYRAVRGRTVVAALCDEIAFWRSDDSANPDREILNALRPAMATIPNALLICLSSPYARRGVLYEAHRDHFAKDGDPVLVWQAPTRVMNPTVPQSFIDAAYEADPMSAAAEYGALFRSDVENFIAREVVDNAAIEGRHEIPFVQYTPYVAFCDPSGGSQDSFTLGVAHREGDRLVLDLLREHRPPFSPDAVVQEYCEILKSYDLTNVTGDRYGGEWPRERFSAHGISYTPSELTRSDIYLELLPKLMSGRVELLDNSRLITQLSTLERRTSRSGRDSIDHAPGGKDDVANSAAGALVLAIRKGGDPGDFILQSPSGAGESPWRTNDFFESDWR